MEEDGDERIAAREHAVETDVEHAQAMPFSMAELKRSGMKRPSVTPTKQPAKMASILTRLPSSII